MYIYICSQITAASDWPRLFLHPRCFCLVFSFAVVIYTSVHIHLSYIDIDECTDDNGGCQHICNNTGGSYYCSCNPGYSVNLDQQNCTGKC